MNSERTQAYGRIVKTLEDVDALAEHLVASDRWSEERAQQLVEDILACGPVTPVG